MDAVVVTHNSARDLEGLVACRPLREAFDRLIVVDNASSDRSVQIARDAGAEVIARDVNDAFGAAANLGAQRTRGDAFCLLNPDIRFDRSGDLAALAGHLAQPGVGAVAPALVLPDGRLQDSCRDIPTPRELIERRLHGSTAGARWGAEPADVPWAVAACLLLRREAFDAVGGFDVRYRLYFEDVDLCLRMREAGWRVRADQRVRVQHFHRADSRASLTGWATRQHVRSAARFFAGHPAFLVRTRPPRPRPRATFVAWSSRGDRGAEIARAVGGEARAYGWPAGGGPLRVAARWTVSAARMLAHCVVRRPRALIVQNPPVFAGLVGWSYARASGAPLVLDSHPASFGAKQDRLWRALLPLHAWLARRAALSLVTVEELAERVERWGGRAAPLHEAPPLWSVAPPTPLGARPRVLAVTVFAGDEPVAELLEAARLVPEADVAVTGDPQRCPAALRAAAPDNVTLTGFLRGDDYRAAVEAADVLVVLTTASTSVVRAGYEAVYAQRPLVVSDTPALRDAFPLAVHAANTPDRIAAALREAIARHDELAARAPEALRIQRERWDRQLARLEAALA